MSSVDLRLGLIGCGPRGCTLVDTIDSMTGVRIVALCDRFQDRLHEAAGFSSSSDCHLYTDYHRILDDPNIDAVYVAIEPDNIPDLVVECLDAGKHVLSEVPMSFTLDGIWKVLCAVERTGLKYMLGESMRYSPFIEEWKRMADGGMLGEIVSAEGQYLHGMGDDRYFQDPKTGERISIERAKKMPDAIKSRLWKMPHPILYLPHELSPLLRVMDDRVTSVVCMGTQPGSFVHDFFPYSDLETALMKTAKGALMRLSVGFTVHQPRKPITMYHWYALMGTQGSVETHRTKDDKMKLVLVEDGKAVSKEVWYDFEPSQFAEEALRSGHGGLDYWAVRHFANSVLNDVTPMMDVYTAAESAAPAILAAESADHSGKLMDVPDFRPGSHRCLGQLPQAKGLA